MQEIPSKELFPEALASAGLSPDFTKYRYDETTVESIENITQEAIAATTARYNHMLTNRELTFGGVIDPIEEADDTLRLACARFEVTLNLHPDHDVREAARKATVTLSEYDHNVAYRKDIYQLVKDFSQTDEGKDILSGDAKRRAEVERDSVFDYGSSAELAEADENILRVHENTKFLEEVLRAYRRRGLDLDDEKRARLEEIDNTMSKLSEAFDANIAEHTNWVTFSRQQLTGVPSDCIERIKSADPNDHADGALSIDVSGPEFVTIMENATNRHTRQATHMARLTRVVSENPPLMEEMIVLRREKAAILGYKSWADYQLEEKMAKTPETVQAFYKQLIPPLTEKALQEIAVMTDMLHSDGIDGPLRRYDTSYYTNKICEQSYEIDQQEVSRYFPIDAALHGLFETTSTIFGVTYREVSDADTWHPDVKTYAVDDAETGKEIARFYLDLYPRDGKYKHAAAMNSTRGRELPDGSYRHPESVMMVNFPKPTEDKPSLLSHDDVQTLFHEFGHVLHGLLTKAHRSSFAGTSVARDFVEAPSQINENWAWEPEVLRSISKHYQTGEPMPDEMIQHIIDARHVNDGLFNLNQVTLGVFDMALHSEDAGLPVGELYDKTSAIVPLPITKGGCMPATFAHLMHGYDAGYYGYMWSLVYGDDMYSRFQEQGVLSPKVGKAWREWVYEMGDTLDAIELVEGFLSRKPNSDAFARNLGIVLAAQA